MRNALATSLTLAAALLTPAAPSPTHAAVVTVGTPRSTMTAPNPLLDPYRANASTTVGGFPVANHTSLTYLWSGIKDGQTVDYYAASAHQNQGGFNLQKIYLGENYKTDSNPINIIRKDLSSSIDLMIIIAEAAPHPARDPNTKLGGWVVANQSPQGSQGPGTIYGLFSAPDSLALINQVTNSNITLAQILAGETIFAVPTPGNNIWSRGVGGWAQYGQNLNNQDGLSGQWFGKLLSTPPTTSGFTDPTKYISTEFRSSAPLNGYGENGDSGSPGIIILPEPTTLPLLAAALTLTGLHAQTHAAVLLDGTTRAQMTAVNPALEGFYASGTSTGYGQPLPYNHSLTHLWGEYYAAARHSFENGSGIRNVIEGRDYVNNPGAPIGIQAVYLSPVSDLAIIKATVPENSPRNPSSRLFGIAVAVTYSTTIYNTFFGNLDFINQITGSSFTKEQVLAGQTIFAAPSVGTKVWSSGYGVWGTTTGDLFDPDGLPTQWQGPQLPPGQGLGGVFTNSNYYVATSFLEDGANGPMNGVGATLDSGSPGIIILPEPTTLPLLAAAATVLTRKPRRRPRPLPTALAAALTLSATTPSPTHAAIIPDGANNADYIAYGAAHAGRAAWVKKDNGSGGTTIAGSGFLLTSYDLITARHIGDAVLVGNSLNFSGSPAPTSTVESTYISSQYNGDFNSSPDFQILHLATPIPINGQIITDPINIAAPHHNQVLRTLEYGRQGHVSDGIWPVDGNLKGSNSRIDILSVSNGINFSTSALDGSVTDLPGNVFLIASGAGMVDIVTGDLIGLAEGGPSTVSTNMYAVGLNLSTVKTEILANLKGPTMAPEPATLPLLAAAATLLTRKPRRRPRPLPTALAAALTLTATTPSPTHAALLLDGTTRGQMTAVNPHLEGFYASAPSSNGGEPFVFNSSVTHLWGKYYAAARHSLTNGSTFTALCLGRDYISNPGALVGIQRIDLSPISDIAIVTAVTADDRPRDPNSRLVGIAVAATPNSTIYNTFLGNLDFINQVTGSNITVEQVLSGNSIIAAPVTGDHLWSSGYGAWGTPSTGLFNPDGLPTQWQGTILPPGHGLNGAFSDTTFYRATSFINDSGVSNGPMNGVGKSLDSGSPGILIFPEPTTLPLLAAAATLLAHKPRRRPRPLPTALAAALTLTAATPSPTHAAVVLDGTTRAEMTAVNPALEGFYASASSTIFGEPLPTNTSLTHLWGPYYATARHSVTDGGGIVKIYLGRDYVNDPGNPIGIQSIHVSSQSDLAIIVATQADDSPRDPNSRLVGIAVGATSSTTIYNTFISNLEFINQVTGSSFTRDQVLAGQTIFAAPGQGSPKIWSSGYGVWGTPSTGLFETEGLPTTWQGPELPTGVGIGGAYSNASYYVATSFINDGGASNGPLNGVGRNGDSGSPGIIILPEPTTLPLLAAAATLLTRKPRRRPRPLPTALAAALTLSATTPSPTHAAVLLDGTTRAQMTAVNPYLEGFYASGTIYAGGFPSPYNGTVTHLWGRYYATAAHYWQNGLSGPGPLYSGRDYINNPGSPVAIQSVHFSPVSDLAILVAAVADDKPRHPDSRLLGIAVAANYDENTTIYNTFLGNLDFINQVTGSTITQQDVLSGNSIIAAPLTGQPVWSSGYGVWGTYSSEDSPPDGLPTQWQAPLLAPGQGLAGAYTNTSFYRATSFVNDGGVTNGPMNGLGATLDSGSVGIIILPEPTTLPLLAAAATLLTRKPRRRPRPSPTSFAT